MQIATAGNLAGPLSPLESDIGAASEFSVYHLMDVDDPVAPFPICHETIGTPGRDDSRWPTYVRQVKEKSTAAQILEAALKEMRAQRPDPVARWQEAVARGDKTIKLRDVATVLRSKNVCASSWNVL